MQIRKAIEDLLERWSQFVVRRPWPVALVVLAATLALLPQFRDFRIDVSIESYLAQTDKSIEAYDAFRQAFGNDSTAMLSIETEGVFDLETLARLKAFHEAIEERGVHVHKLTSLVNVRHVRGEGDELIVEDLLELWPKTGAEIPAFRELVYANPTYVGNFISADGKVAALVVEAESYSASALETLDLEAGFDDEAELGSQTQNLGRDDYMTPAEEAAFVTRIMEITDEFSQSDFRIHVAGMPVANYRLSVDLGKETTLFMLLAIGTIAILLGVLFRRVSGVLFPLLTVQLSVVATLALMPALGFPLTGNTQILPSFLLAVGMAASVHILSIFYQRYDAGAERKDAIVYAMRSTAFAVIMTSLTTAVGLLSFTVADLIPIVGLGIFGPIGVFLALLYTVTLLPALLVLLPVKRLDSSKQDQQTGRGVVLRLDRALVALGDFASTHARSILLTTLLLCILAIAGFPRLTFSHDPLRWYPPEHSMRVASELADSRMSGTLSLEVLVDTQEDNGLYEPAVMKALNSVTNFGANLQVLGATGKKMVAITDVLKETHQALNSDQEGDFYTIPDARGTIAQELLLFESSGADDLEDFVDPSYRVARLTLIMPWTNAIHFEEFIETLQAGMEERMQGLGVDIQVTGVMAIFARTIHAILTTMVKSYALAFTFVTVLMIFILGSVRLGLISMIPNLIPIVFTLGLMGWVGIPLNMLTTLLGCIIIGIAVDDTIHFMHHFRKLAPESASPQEAIHKTLQTVGRALLFTSIVLAAGFFLFLAGEFSSTRTYGILLGFAIIVALLADLIIAPALMTVFWKSQRN